MKITKISYEVPLEQIKDIENDNIDVFVEMDDGMTYTFTVSTPKNYYWYMDKESTDYVHISSPEIIVRKLTDEIIKEAIQNSLENAPDGYWLKLYLLAPSFDIKILDKMIEDIKKENDEIFGTE